jgi:hypothetical protein
MNQQQPESVLYRVIDAHLDAFLETTRSRYWRNSWRCKSLHLASGCRSAARAYRSGRSAGAPTRRRGPACGLPDH